MTKTRKHPHLSVLARMSDSELWRFFNANAQQVKQASVDSPRNFTNWYITTRYERFWEKTKDALWAKFKDRVRNRRDISVLPFKEGTTVPLRDRNRGKRRFFTLEQQQKATERFQRRHNGLIYNGMTFKALSEAFKCDVFHEMGNGFFWYPDHPRIKKAASRN